MDPALIDYFQSQLEGHYRADMFLGPHDLIGTVSEQFRLIDKLVRSARGETRRGLLRVGAAYAALVGWLYQDAGDLGDGYGVIDLCEAALDNSGHLVPKVRIMALQQQAHGASLTGDRAAVDRLIDTAIVLIHRVDDDLPWGNACRRTPGYLEVQRATCYGRLGLAREAGVLRSQALDAVPSTARRDRGVYLARQATAAAAGREPDRALEIVRSAVGIAVETGSVRLARELATLERAMRPWRDAGVGRDLAEILAPVAEGA